MPRRISNSQQTFLNTSYKAYTPDTSESKRGSSSKPEMKLTAVLHCFHALSVLLAYLSGSYAQASAGCAGGERFCKSINGVRRVFDFAR